MNRKVWFHTSAFSLIELLLVIIIILILFVASKSLFQTPNKYLIDSEVCINAINGRLSQFFYQGITGKDKVINNTTYEPNSYRISFSGAKLIPIQTQTINLAVSETGNTYYTDSNIIMDATTASIPSCTTANYSVLISGSIFKNGIYTGSSFITILFNKNLTSSSDGRGGMTICDKWDCSNIFVAKIDYLTCKKTPWSSNINTGDCKHIFSNRFDTATQSVKSNRCLSISANTSCQKRSIDNF